MTIKVGDRLPNVSVRLVTPDGPKPGEADVSSATHLLEQMK